MITGQVTDQGEAVIPLVVRGPAGHEQSIQAIIDTGFNGFLTLPFHLVETLGLIRLSRGRALLANGQEAIFDIYGSTVLWDGMPREVEADAVESIPLVGMSLLYGYELIVHAVEGGRVLISAPP